MLRTMILSTLLSVATLGVVAGTPSVASAHPFGGYGRGYGGYGRGYGGYNNYSGYGGYYGNGGHDAYPHWHNTATPYGNYSYYGTGLHDYLPHSHAYSPYGITSYSSTPWRYTESYAPSYPSYYGGW